MEWVPEWEARGFDRAKIFKDVNGKSGGRECLAYITAADRNVHLLLLQSLAP
jgi:hypothetical protein